VPDDREQEPEDETEAGQESWTGSTIGWMSVAFDFDADGMHAVDVPEHEAITAAMPQWVRRPEHRAAAEAFCLDLAAHPHPRVRAAVLEALGELATRYRQFDQRERVVRALELGLRDRDAEVRDAAAAATTTTERLLGWRVSRPVV
jgi:hypothetical protein